jgi:methyltransferase (TIGR00027 family)
MSSPAAIGSLALTAFYCCALRAADAERATPVCGDSLAARFLDPATLERLQPALLFRGPAASNVARHRIIDDMLRAALGTNPRLRIVILGAGLDTRAFRLQGGQWWELEDPPLLAYKEEKLPARAAPNALIRIPVDFATADLREHLASLAGPGDTFVVLEGVSMYLPAAVLTKTAAAVREAFPRAPIVCDLMSPAFRRRFAKGLHGALQGFGAHFAESPAHPRLAIEAAGYRMTSAASIVDRAREAGSLRIPRWLLSTLLRELRDGYSVCTFTAAS